MANDLLGKARLKIRLCTLEELVRTAIKSKCRDKNEFVIYDKFLIEMEKKWKNGK